MKNLYCYFRAGLIIPVFFVIVIISFTACNQPPKKENRFGAVKTVNPNASPEVKKLMYFLDSISGHYSLSAQHNYMSQFTLDFDSIHALTGKYPAIWGSDFGFADSTHDTDNIAYRPDLLKQIEKQFHAGSLITLTYHQANPVMGEPTSFKGGVQSDLTDAQWKELITPGTPLYNDWKKQMELLGGYLKKLQDEHIPILFRPYHEMNGDWFWWGGRPGDSGYIALYRNLFDLYTNELKLNNLVWIWSTDNPILYGFGEYYPGDKYVDIVGCDLYAKGDTTVLYRKDIYDMVRELAGDKPIVVGEQAKLPSPEVLLEQPRWEWFMAWDGLVFTENDPASIIEFYNNPSVLSRGDLPAWLFN